MEKLPIISIKSVFLVICILVMASTAPGGVEARGEFKCPRMIECNSVCQGFPNCCLNGRCFCQPCSTLPPPR
ncbi:hypothetical protein L484_026515 [Morus notabilis]|uniref:Uncharacterized protein n=1 Tax=Morus notabilis TaxID=981085 RepID=W9RAR4_9ROSA|nr:hypothetical protein L484_026515 [Morus notabilis]